MKIFKSILFSLLSIIVIYSTVSCNIKDNLLEEAVNLCIEKYDLPYKPESFALDEVLFNDEIIYFIHSNDNGFWCESLFQLFFDENNKLDDVVSRGGGNVEFFEYNIVSLSQGNFLAVFNASHQGNGTIEYYSINEKNEECIFNIRAIDGHYEEMAIVALEYGYTDKYNDYIGGSMKQTLYKSFFYTRAYLFNTATKIFDYSDEYSNEVEIIE